MKKPAHTPASDAAMAATDGTSVRRTEAPKTAPPIAIAIPFPTRFPSRPANGPIATPTR